MFRTIMVGLPGMYLGMYFATAQSSQSLERKVWL
jgi:hypothetical protein